MDSVDVFVILDHVQYTKRDWRNRNFIQSPQGRVTLSIPVKTKGKYFQTIQETEIANSSWKRKHLNSIYLNYKKATCFEQYFPIIDQIYHDCETLSLSAMNIHLLRRFSALLDIKTNLITSIDSDENDRNQRLIAICKKLGIDEYHTGASALNYMNHQLFKDAGIQVVFHHYQHMIPYPQHSNIFVDQLSIIDTILHCGEASIHYIHPSI
jgi:hypothetical protein